MGARGSPPGGRRARVVLPQPLSLPLERIRTRPRRAARPDHALGAARRVPPLACSGTWRRRGGLNAYVTNSVATQERIRRCYRRECGEYPPVDTVRLAPSPPGDHYGAVRARHPQADRHDRHGVLGAWPAACGRGRRAARWTPWSPGGGERVIRRPRKRPRRRRTPDKLPGPRRRRERGVRIVAVEAQARAPGHRPSGGRADRNRGRWRDGCLWSGGADDLAHAVAGLTIGRSMAVRLRQARPALTPACSAPSFRLGSVQSSSLKGRRAGRTSAVSSRSSGRPPACGPSARARHQ